MSRRGRERTPEEREAARRERERRRYERAGRPIPPHLLEEPRPADSVVPELSWDLPSAEPAGEESAAGREAAAPPSITQSAPAQEPPADDPQPTVQWDVSEAWEDAPSEPSERRASGPVADEVAVEDDAEATRPHELPGEADPHATRPHHVAADSSADRSDPGAEAAAPGRERPLGTRRVSGRERRQLPHVYRPSRGAAARRTGRGVRVKRPGEGLAGPSRRRTSVAARMLALGVLLLGVVIVWFLVSLFQPFAGDGEGGGSVTVTVPRGATASEIGDLLAARGVVSSGFFFELRAGLSGARGDLHSGTFRLREGMSYAAAIDALSHVAPPPPTVTVAIPEGRSRRETVALVRQAGLRGDYMAATRGSRLLNVRRYGAPAGATLEGFLFPATYELRRGARVQDLVAQQLRAFRRTLATVDLRYARSRNLTAFDVLTIASMVEREVSVPRERPVVAAVIYNRLRDGIPLGIDATLRFERNDWVNPLRQSVLEADTPYNTRLRQGLPPGPIGNPGLASIQAAARPARTNALYYVVKPGTCGEHAFAATYEEHLQNVARYEAARRAAGGRSPTRC